MSTERRPCCQGRGSCSARTGSSSRVISGSPFSGRGEGAGGRQGSTIVAIVGGVGDRVGRAAAPPAFAWSVFLHHRFAVFTDAAARKRAVGEIAAVVAIHADVTAA